MNGALLAIMSALACSSATRANGASKAPSGVAVGDERQLVKAPAAPAVLDHHVAALGIAAFAQALVKAAEAGRLPVMCLNAEESDDGHTLCARRRGRRDGRTAEQTDEATPVH